MCPIRCYVARRWHRAYCLNYDLKAVLADWCMELANLDWCEENVEKHYETYYDNVLRRIIMITVQYFLTFDWVIVRRIESLLITRCKDICFIILSVFDEFDSGAPLNPNVNIKKAFYCDRTQQPHICLLCGNAGGCRWLHICTVYYYSFVSYTHGLFMPESVQPKFAIFEL